MTQTVRTLNWLIFSSLSLLALYYYLERGIFLDSAFKFFDIIATESFSIQANRYGDYFTQIVPLALIHLDLPIPVIFRTYGLSFILLAIISYIVSCRFFHKNVAYLLPLSLMAISSHGFFWFTNEQFTAYPFLVLAWSIFLSRDRGFVQRGIGHLSLFIALITHPLAMVVHFFILLFSLINRSFSKQSAFYISVSTAVILLLKNSILKNNYDASSFGRLKLNNIENLFQSHGWIQFQEHLWSELIGIPILGVVALSVLIYHRFFLLSVFTLGYSLFYIFINILSNCEGTAWFHYESHFMPLGIILTFPIFYLFEKYSSKVQRLVVISLFLFSGLKLLHIISIAPDYKARLNYTQSLLHLTDKHPYILIPDNAPIVNDNYQHWAMSYETMTHSLVKNGELRSVLIFKNDERQRWRLDIEELVQGGFTNYPLSEINQRKLRIKDTRLKYKLLSTVPLPKEETVFQKNQSSKKSRKDN